VSAVSQEVLAVFARAPALGGVKTRLSPPLTADEALALHRALVEDTLESLGRVERPSLSRLLLLSEPLKRATDLDVPRNWSVGTQSAGELGERLASLFHTSFRRGVERVVVLGSDSPTLPLEAVEEAFERLAVKDAVLGPAEDGGYYLVGCRLWIPEMFRGITWGSAEVLGQTRAALERAGRSLDLLIPWYDIDRGEDLEKLRQEVAYLTRARPELVPKRVAAMLPAPSEIDEYFLGEID
jgi:hypothetical protein